MTAWILLRRSNIDVLLGMVLVRSSLIIRHDFHCYVFSWDSNWSLNAALMKRDTMLHKLYPSSRGSKSMADIGLSHWDKQVN